MHFQVLASGNLPQRQQYHNPSAPYYFRPYNYSSIPQQQQEATWAKRPGQPYANDVFKNVYAQVEANGVQPVHIAPSGAPSYATPEGIPAPLQKAAPSDAAGAASGKSATPMGKWNPVTPVPSAPKPLDPPSMLPSILPGPPTP